MGRREFVPECAFPRYYNSATDATVAAGVQPHRLEHLGEALASVFSNRSVSTVVIARSKIAFFPGSTFPTH